MNTDWDVDMSGTGQVSGWGDDNFDIADMLEMKKNTTKKSKKEIRTTVPADLINDAASLWPGWPPQATFPPLAWARGGSRASVAPP